jgi:hypothetical protein
MSNIVVLTRWDLFERWWKVNGQYVTLVLWLLSVVFVVTAYLRATGGTGCVLVFFLVILFAFASVFVSAIIPYGIFVTFLLSLGAWVFVEKAIRIKRQKYLPALVSVEGGGVKRGLTAPEAALLLELPANKVVTLILFGMLKKGLIRQIKKDPLEFELVAKPPSEIIIQPYEKMFLSTLQDEAKKGLGTITLKEADFSGDLQAMVKSVVEKMKGFNVDETKSYYGHIISRAWTEAKDIGDIQLWQKKMDERIDWLLLDRDFDTRFQPYSYHYVPRVFRSGGSGAGLSLPQIGSSPTSSAGAPTFSDLAGSVAGWMQNTAESVVSSTEKAKPLLDLSSLDKGSSGGGRSGGGGGCACACAGCACACACAGGGR